VARLAVVAITGAQWELRPVCIEAAWHVPAGALEARSGTWLPGPGADFFRVAEQELGTLPFIAEDLGLITPEVNALRNQFHLPGMRVLQFAFDGHPDNPYLPVNYVTNTEMYTGTRDNPTTRDWFEDLTGEQPERIMAALTIAPLQALLNLGREARMNASGRADGNWRWPCTENILSDSDLRMAARSDQKYQATKELG
jgi:4-alpha-glucanotransferase